MRRNESMKKVEGGRSGTKGERNRWNIKESEWTIRTECSISSIRKEKGWLLRAKLQIWEEDCHSVEEFFSIERRINSDQNQKGNNATERIERQFTTHLRDSTKQDSCTTRDQYCMAHYTFTRLEAFFVSPIRIWLPSLSDSLIICKDNFGCLKTFVLIRTKDSSGVTECNQDFVAPAPCHIPLWAVGLVIPSVTPALDHMPIMVVSVRVREHPHRERMPSGVVSWSDR